MTRPVYNLNVDVLNVVPALSETVLISFLFFLLYSVPLKLFPPFHLPAHLSILLLQFLTLSYLHNVFNLSYCIVHC